MPRTTSYMPLLLEIASSQDGYLTASQVSAIGVPNVELAKMARRGTLERKSHGVYRISAYPLVPHGQLWEAVLWSHVRGKGEGVLSHETALAEYEISDINPRRVHITLPPERSRRDPPGYLRIHFADLRDDEVTTLKGLPITSVYRTIIDCIDASVGGAIATQAIDEAFKRRTLTDSQARDLRSRLSA